MAQMTVATSSGGKQYLTEKAVVYGLLTNITSEATSIGFLNPGTYDHPGFFLGYNSDFDVVGNWGNYLNFNIYIPSNFVIDEAKITLIHTPVKWDNGGDYSFWGWCRNLKAYKITNYDDLLIFAAYASTYDITGQPTFEEIPNAFGASGYTPSVPSDLTHPTETAISTDISSYLTPGVNNMLAIKSGDVVPTYNADLVTNATAIGTKTGFARAIITVIGHTQ